jgi:hypothetical protein
MTHRINCCFHEVEIKTTYIDILYCDCEMQKHNKSAGLLLEVMFKCNVQ